MVRESVGCSVNSSHLEWRLGQGDIDRVTALGLAGVISPIGELYYRVYVAQDRASIGPLIQAVTAKVRPARKVPTSWREAIARQAVRELVDWACQTCDGRGEVASGTGVVYVCQACCGVRVRRYDDIERANGIGVDMLAYHRVFEKPLLDALCLVRREVSLVNMALAEKLCGTVLCAD